MSTSWGISMREWLPADLGHDQPDPWDDQPDWIGDDDGV